LADSMVIRIFSREDASDFKGFAMVATENGL